MKLKNTNHMSIYGYIPDTERTLYYKLVTKPVEQYNKHGFIYTDEIESDVELNIASESLVKKILLYPNHRDNFKNYREFAHIINVAYYGPYPKIQKQNTITETIEDIKSTLKAFFKINDYQISLIQYSKTNKPLVQIAVPNLYHNTIIIDSFFQNNDFKLAYIFEDSVNSLSVMHYYLS